jgi:hypothetical protein
MQIHELKTIQPYFDDVWCDRKTFEIRKNDRYFQINDLLVLKEYNGMMLRNIVAKIIYILDDVNYVKEGFVILGIKILEKCL